MSLLGFMGGGAARMRSLHACGWRLALTNPPPRIRSPSLAGMHKTYACGTRDFSEGCSGLFATFTDSWRALRFALLYFNGRLMFLPLSLKNSICTKLMLLEVLIRISWVW